MARILDFYAVRWEYEPRQFPILWNLDGDVVESFSPDFYLPDLDLYVEMTTLRQSLVRKKNRKLRRLRELYPSFGLKLFYARDFRALMLKYGGSALVDALIRDVRPGPRAPCHRAGGCGDRRATRIAGLDRPTAPTVAPTRSPPDDGDPEHGGGPRPPVKTSADLVADIAEILLSEEAIRAKVAELGRGSATTTRGGD